MKNNCFKIFAFFLIIFKIFCTIHIPLKIVPNNHNDVQITSAAYQEKSAPNHNLREVHRKVCDLAFFFCESIISFEIAKFVYEITKVHVYHWQLPRVGIGGIIAKENECSVLFPTAGHIL
jgi:hypothetical protein